MTERDERNGTNRAEPMKPANGIGIHWERNERATRRMHG